MELITTICYYKEIKTCNMLDTWEACAITYLSLESHSLNLSECVLSINFNINLMMKLLLSSTEAIRLQILTFAGYKVMPYISSCLATSNMQRSASAGLLPLNLSERSHAYFINSLPSNIFKSITIRGQFYNYNLIVKQKRCTQTYL